MQPTPSGDRDQRLSGLADLLTIVTALIASVVLLGWVLHYEPFKRIAPGLTSMNPLTAVCFLLLCTALMVVRGRLVIRFPMATARVLAGIVALLGFLKGVDLILMTRFTPDDLLFASQLDSGQAYPSRMAPNTALCFFMLSLGIFFATLPPAPRLPSLQLSAVPTLLMALLAILGYSYDTAGFYKLVTFIPMALHTAVCFTLLSLCLLLLRPSEGFVGLLTGNSDASKTARTLLPACILIPVLLGWCAITGLRLEYYGLGTATSLLVLLIVAAQCIVVLMVSSRLNREEIKRVTADRALAAQRADVEAKAAELADTNARLQYANAAKSSFLSSMSHEIRTPMNAVIGMTSLLLDTPLTREQSEHAETIRSSGEHLLTIINEILDFSKIEAGQMQLENSQFELRQCVEDAIDLIAVIASQKQLELTYYIEAGADTVFLGDVGRLRQILVNLLSNAVKFTSQGEVTLKVQATPAASGWCDLQFSVRDTGIGIPAERLDQLFQPFMQVDASITRRYGGTGLGLVISQKLAHLMGGKVWVESTPGLGSTFHCKISAEIAERTQQTRSTPVALSGKRLLAVDDNPTNLSIVKAYARTWGMDCVGVDQPAAALELLGSGAVFDVAVLDYQMPDLDGVQLATAMRRLPGGANLPLVLLSSVTVSRPDLRTQDPRFAVLIAKPVKPAALEAAVIEALSHAPSIKAPAPERRKMPIDGGLAASHPLRILLVEDNLVNQKVATLLLAKLGYTTDVAANGLEAIAAVQRQTYDLVLMDVQMPEMDGLEASQQIVLRWPQGQRPRIVGMTANATDDDQRECRKAGMDDYLSKPVTVPQLTAALQRTSRLDR